MRHCRKWGKRTQLVGHSFRDGHPGTLPQDLGTLGVRRRIFSLVVSVAWLVAGSPYAVCPTGRLLLAVALQCCRQWAGPNTGSGTRAVRVSPKLPARTHRRASSMMPGAKAIGIRAERS
nr:unnamed protein product [Digitaria exilis]